MVMLSALLQGNALATAWQQPGHEPAQQQQQQQLVSCFNALVATWHAVFDLLLLPDDELRQQARYVCMGASQGLEGFILRDCDKVSGCMSASDYGGALRWLDSLHSRLQYRHTAQPDATGPPTQDC